MDDGEEPEWLLEAAIALESAEAHEASAIAAEEAAAAAAAAAARRKNRVLNLWVRSRAKAAEANATDYRKALTEALAEVAGDNTTASSVADGDCLLVTTRTTHALRTQRAPPMP